MIGHTDTVATGWVRSPARPNLPATMSSQAATDAPTAERPDGATAEPTRRRIRPRSMHRSKVEGGGESHDGVERSWTPVGTLDAGVLAEVDGGGAVRLSGASWSLDWWIGAEDRWHHPSEEAAVRQQCVGSAPIVETAMRVPGGDVLCRSFGVVARAGEWNGPAIVVEVENLSSVPVALAFAVRPLVLDGIGSLRTVSSKGPTVAVDGHRMLLSREPARVVSGPLDTVAGLLADGGDAVPPLDASSASGDLEAAFVVPLTHTAVSRVLLPCVDPHDRSGVDPTSPWEAPDLEAVAGGWSAHGGALWTSGPEPEWDSALTWADRMLRLSGPEEVGAGLDRARQRPLGPSAAVRAAEIAEAMARFGAADASLPIARGLADAQRIGGAVRMGDRSDASVALLHAAGAAMDGADPDGAVVESILAPTAVAVRRVRRGKGTAGGLTPSAVRALRLLAPVLEQIGQPEVADDARSAAASLAASVAGSTVRSDDGDVSSLGARSTVEIALGVRRDIARRSSDVVADLRALWSGASWRGRSDAELVDPDCGAVTAAGVLGFDAAELAARTNALLDLYVSDGGGERSGPVLLPVFDPVWVGRSIEAHDLPTPWGPAGYAVRWHGRRPAVLWEITGADDEVTVSAPGLDGSWTGRGAEGEALLAEMPVPETTVLITLGGSRSAGPAGSTS